MYWHIVFTMIICGVFTASASPINSIETEDIIQRARQSRIDLIGQVGKKLFFRSNENELPNGTNWMDANGRCIAAGLQFAKFDSPDDENFIYHQYPGTPFWLGAQLRNQQRYEGHELFRWGADGSDGVAGGMNFMFTSGSWQCLWYFSDVIYPGICTTQRRQFLCQLVLP